MIAPIRERAGFTMIELLISLAIFVLIVAMILSSFSKLRDERVLDAEAEKVLSVFHEARNKTMSSEDDSVYGVHLETSRAVLFTGAIYNPMSLSNKSFLLDARTMISVITLNGGGSNVVFTRLTGGTSNYGTTTISLVKDPSKVRHLLIKETGIFERSK